MSTNSQKAKKGRSGVNGMPKRKAEVPYSTQQREQSASVSMVNGMPKRKAAIPNSTQQREQSASASLDVPRDFHSAGEVRFRSGGQVKDHTMSQAFNTPSSRPAVRAEPAQQMPATQKDSAPQNILVPQLASTVQAAIEADTIPEKDSTLQIPCLPKLNATLQAAVAAEDPATSQAQHVAALESRNGFLFRDTRGKAQVYYVYAKDGVMQIVGYVGDSIATLYDSSKERVKLAMKPFKPYYVKVQSGIASILGRIDNTTVAIQLRMSDVRSSIQTRAMAPIKAARVVILPYANPMIARGITLRNTILNRVERFAVSIKGGVVCVRGAAGDSILRVQTTLSDIIGSICVKTAGTLNKPKQAITELTTKLVAFISKARGESCAMVQLMYAKAKNGILHVACQVNGKVMFLKIKLAEVMDFMRSKRTALCSTSYAAIVDVYTAAKVKVLSATEIARMNSIQAGANIRSFAGNQKAQVTAVSAAGGAVALGASGGAAGLLAGGGLGFGCGAVLAPFTLGLSIPVGTAVGAGAGLCIGTTAGGTAGFITGGAAGYGVHNHKDDIGNGVNGALSKAKAYKAIAAASTNKLCAQVIGSTGGSFA